MWWLLCYEFLEATHQLLRNGPPASEQCDSVPRRADEKSRGSFKKLIMVS